MLSDQQRARWFGVLFLITFVTSIPALALYQPVLDDPVGYIAGGGHNNQIFFGVLLELLLIIANIGTAVVIYPIVRRQSEELALGYVKSRPFVGATVIGATTLAQLREDVQAAARTLDADTLAALAAILVRYPNPAG